MPIQVNSQSELIREPNLTIPRQIPVGPVKVDFSHPIAKGCHGFFLGRDAGSAMMPNYAAPAHTLVPRISGLGTAAPVTETSEFGMVYDSSADELGCYRDPDQHNSWWKPTIRLTYMCQFKLFSHQSAGGTPMSRADTSNGAYTYTSFKIYSSSIVWYYKDSGNSQRSCSSSIALTLNKWYTIAGIVGSNDQVGVAGLYLDGIEIAEVETGPSGITSDSSAENTHFRLSCGHLDDTTRAFDGQIAWAGMWYNRALHGNEILELDRDPYQILIPA